MFILAPRHVKNKYVKRKRFPVVMLVTVLFTLPIRFRQTYAHDWHKILIIGLKNIELEIEEITFRVKTFRS